MEREVWYEPQCCVYGTDYWYEVQGCQGKKFDSYEAANNAVTWPIMGYDYRVVRKTLTTEVVSQ